MCVEIYNRENRESIGNLGKLRAAVGVENIVPNSADYKDAVYDWPDFTCLCPVDVFASVARVGYKAVQVWSDAGTVHIWKDEANAPTRESGATD